MNNSQLSTPILFLIFNRLETTKQVLTAIRQAQPTRLYVAADGPRPNHLGEAEKVQAVRDYVISYINWDCEVKTLFREENLGCRVAVSGAIDWFFEHEAEGIILEDDCIPDASFFPYVEELLNRYRDDERIMVIAGNHFHGEAHQPSYSYFFSRYNHCWGWATWRRAWQHYDHDMSQWPKLRNTNWLITIGDGNRNFQRYWTRIFDQAYAQKVDSWAYRWTFSCWAQSGLTILPALNLVKNIGFDENATHTKSKNGSHKLSTLPLESLTFSLSHPSNVIRDYEADRWSDLNLFKISQINNWKNRLKKIILKRK
jgi:hypothetical protein